MFLEENNPIKENNIIKNCNPGVVVIVELSLGLEVEFVGVVAVRVSRLLIIIGDSELSLVMNPKLSLVSINIVKTLFLYRFIHFKFDFLLSLPFLLTSIVNLGTL